MTPSTPVDMPSLIGANLLSDLGRALRYHIWLILAVAVGTVLVAYASLQFISNEYVSSARLLVKLGRENVELPVTVEKGGLLSTGVRKEEINSEIQLIGSRPLIEATVDQLGLQAFKLEPAAPVTWFQRVKAQLRGMVRAVKQQFREGLILLNLRQRLTEREEAILLVQKTLAVEREKDSDVISVSVRLPSDLLAMQVVDTLLQLYLERRVEVRRDRGISDFFDEQLGTLRQQLGSLDAGKQRLRDQGKISGINEERGLLLSRLQNLYAQIANDERELRLLAPARSLAASVALPPALAASAALSSFPNVEQLRSKVTELRLRRTDLLQKFTEGAEPVERVDREIAQIESTLRQAVQAELSEHRAVSGAIEQRLLALNAGEVGLEVIERDRGLVQQNYLSYAKRREEARISEALDLRRVSNIAVLAKADKPIEPVAPRKMLIIGLAFPFGLLAGFGIALLLEYLNQTIRDERDLSAADRALFLGLLRTFRGPP
ncbi:GumC family protein [Roseateles sp. P5_E8]